MINFPGTWSGGCLVRRRPHSSDRLNAACRKELSAILSLPLVNGFLIETVEPWSPQSVRVLSPEEEEENKETSVMTTPIYLENIREDTRLFCKVVAPPTVQPAGKRWPDVEVRILVSSQE